MKELELQIKPAVGRESDVKEFYSKHGTIHEGDVGFDLYCLEDLVVPARSFSVKMPLGVCVEGKLIKTFTKNDVQKYKYLPTGFYLYPRSSTGSKTPIRLSNSVGIIDAGYRGELMALLDNVSDKEFVMRRGERYFQICGPNLNPISHRLVEKLSDSERGDGGFGSTG